MVCSRPHLHNVECDTPPRDVTVREEEPALFGSGCEPNFQVLSQFLSGVNSPAGSKFGSQVRELAQGPASVKDSQISNTGPCCFFLVGCFELML